MREIKFRAWAHGSGGEREMVYFDLSALNGGEIEDDQAVLDSSIPLMQYTGLKDKNGVEIYEGDIVQWPSQLLGRKGKKDVGFVDWDGAYWIYLTLEKNQFTGFYGHSGALTVIGNIHENPEILPSPTTDQ